LWNKGLRVSPFGKLALFVQKQCDEKYRGLKVEYLFFHEAHYAVSKMHEERIGFDFYSYPISVSVNNYGVMSCDYILGGNWLCLFKLLSVG
jgi:hypothetical protein